MQSKQEKREAGEERNVAYRLLTVEQKVAALDRDLGPGQGAGRQRAKFANQLKEKV
jgi:hypothetical protein